MENLHYGFNYSKKKKSMCEEYSQFSFMFSSQLSHNHYNNKRMRCERKRVRVP